MMQSVEETQESRCSSPSHLYVFWVHKTKHVSSTNQSCLKVFAKTVEFENLITLKIKFGTRLAWLLTIHIIHIFLYYHRYNFSCYRYSYVYERFILAF